MLSPLVCFSHLRWGFVFQRPQHLMTRFARDRRVYFVEEPIVGSPVARLNVAEHGSTLTVLTPLLPESPTLDDDGITRALLHRFLDTQHVVNPVLWFYTPMMLPLAAGLNCRAVVYDCMDELSGFAGAPPELPERERALFERASLVFAGGRTLWEAKRHLHPHVHLCPSSVDTPHFATARQPLRDPIDQRNLPRPRLGYAGVIDERMDLALLDAVAAARPAWQLIMLGPVAKIPTTALPRRPNIHYVGLKPYAELPAYFANWDVALLPFARNAATRYISPTKTPEYLAAGLPVVGTSVRDVVSPYGERGLVRIADTPDLFIAAVEATLTGGAPLAAADAYLAGTSWDATYARMQVLVDAAASAGRPAQTLSVSRAAASLEGGA